MPKSPKNLLLLHGALGDGSQLAALQTALDARVRCHLVEFEGHGRTPSQHQYSIARFTGNVRAYVPAFADILERRHAGAGGWERVLTRTADLMTRLGSHPVVDDAMLMRIRQPAHLMVGDRDTVVSVDETFIG